MDLSIASTTTHSFLCIYYHFDSSRESLGCRRFTSSSFTGMTDSAFTFIEPEAHAIFFNNTLSFFYFSSVLVIIEVSANLFSNFYNYDGKWSPSVG